MGFCHSGPDCKDPGRTPRGSMDCVGTFHSLGGRAHRAGQKVPRSWRTQTPPDPRQHPQPRSEPWCLFVRGDLSRRLVSLALTLALGPGTDREPDPRRGPEAGEPGLASSPLPARSCPSGGCTAVQAPGLSSLQNSASLGLLLPAFSRPLEERC